VLEQTFLNETVEINIIKTTGITKASANNGYFGWEKIHFDHLQHNIMF